MVTNVHKLDSMIYNEEQSRPKQKYKYKSLKSWTHIKKLSCVKNNMFGINF